MGVAVVVGNREAAGEAWGVVGSGVRDAVAARVGAMEGSGVGSGVGAGASPTFIWRGVQGSLPAYAGTAYVPVFVHATLHVQLPPLHEGPYREGEPSGKICAPLVPVVEATLM